MIEKCKRIDIMILCAGVGAHNRFTELTSLDHFQKQMNVNFWSYVYMTRHALPFLKQNKGQILVVSSISGQIPIPFRTLYCASKHALHGFFDTLYLEEDKQIDMTLFCPNTLTGSNFRANSLTGAIPEKISKDTLTVEQAALCAV